MADLHAEIMNLPCLGTMSQFATVADLKLYKQGHRDARHAAAELASAEIATINARLQWLAANGAVIESMVAAKIGGDVPLWYVSESAPTAGPQPHKADPRRLYGESDVSIEAAIDNAMERQAAGKEPYYV